jgi:amino acid transporter
MSMSRDGLLPKRFGKVHKKFHTPSFSTVITGLFVALPTLFLNLTEVTDLTSIGTLFAFIVVCAGILIINRDEIQSKERNEKTGFRVPYYNSKLFLPPIVIIITIALICFNLDGLKTFFSGYKATNIPMYGFLICASYIVYISVKRSLSLIPVLGLLINMYLITELGIANWMRFLIWLIIGIIIYFTYGIKNSKLKNSTVND